MKIEQPGGHIDQFFRQTRTHHAQLSAMADIKANVLLTVSSLMLTFCLPFVGKPMLQWPAVVMITFCALTALTSILVLAPKLPAKGASKIRQRSSFNILFFGSFADMSEEDYFEEMERISNDPARVYEAMTRDIYTLGVFLAKKKYYYLRCGYQLFIAGLFAAGLTFAVVEILLYTGMEVWVFTFGPQEILELGEQTVPGSS